MRLTKSELIALMMTGEYSAVMKRGDWNRDGLLLEASKDERGGTIFRIGGAKRTAPAAA